LPDSAKLEGSMGKPSGAVMMCDPIGWHLQIFETLWVEWGYGPRTDTSVVHVAPACVYLDVGAVVLDLPFELPKHDSMSHLEEPVEYQRRYAVGWRVRTNNMIHDCGWNLAEDEASARVDAATWIATHDGLESALADIRVQREFRRQS
jgi:hypothetical protein